MGREACKVRKGARLGTAGHSSGSGGGGWGTSTRLLGLCQDRVDSRRRGNDERVLRRLPHLARVLDAVRHARLDGASGSADRGCSDRLHDKTQPMRRKNNTPPIFTPSPDAPRQSSRRPQ